MNDKKYNKLNNREPNIFLASCILMIMCIFLTLLVFIILDKPIQNIDLLILILLLPIGMLISHIILAPNLINKQELIINTYSILFKNKYQSRKIMLNDDTELKIGRYNNNKIRYIFLLNKDSSLLISNFLEMSEILEELKSRFRNLNISNSSTKTNKINPKTIVIRILYIILIFVLLFLLYQFLHILNNKNIFMLILTALLIINTFAAGIFIKTLPDFLRSYLIICAIWLLVLTLYSYVKMS